MKSQLLVLLTLALAAAAAHGQTASISGYLASFDILNNSGQPAHGFEIELEGATVADLYYTGFGGRYAMPSIVPYATGVNVRYSSQYAGSWGATTPVAGTTSFAWQDCYQGGAGYATSGCENFGQSLRRSVGITPTGYWLVEDPANPGQLVRANPPATIPFGQWSVFTGPALAVTIPAPVVKAPPAQFGDAVWMKVFKTSLPRSVTGDELVDANSSVVPEAAAQVETSWTVLQKAPPGVQNRRGKGAHIASSPLSITDGSHVRRVETYKYTGIYDALTHEVACADGVCNTPGAGELGAAISANNTAANAVADSLTVTKSGSGASSASVSVGGLSCKATSCANFGTSGATVALTAVPGGTVFGGWTGACGGTAASCTVTINGKTVVDASFLKVFTLSIGRSNAGTVLATPDGNDRALNCGGTCSAKYTDGTSVVLTAVPAAGKTFVSWSGGCSGTGSTCALNVTKDTSVNAVFSK